MKFNTLLINTFCISFLSFGAVFGMNVSQSEIINEPEAVSPQTIDNFDTIYFDLASAVYMGNSVEFPVRFKSDDQIFSLDFSTRFDLTKLTYDSLINLTPPLDPLAWYNPNDSTLRLTSFSLSQLANNTNLVIIKFDILAGQTLTVSDFQVVNTLLNGDACSFSVIPPIGTGIDDFSSAIDQVKLYPNPVSDILNVEVPFKSDILISDITGKILLVQYGLNPGANQIDLSDFEPGHYSIQFTGEWGRGAKTLIISR